MNRTRSNSEVRGGKHAAERNAPRRGRRRALWATVALVPVLVLGTAWSWGGSPLTSSVPTTAPRDGETIPNVTLVEDDIALYYGSVTEAAPSGDCLLGISGSCVTQETVSSPTSNYAKQMESIAAKAQRTLASAIHRYGGPSSRNHVKGKPALVFDVDDTLVSTYNYENAMEFAYTPASNASWVNAEAFPATWGMPALVNWADDHGYAIFFITGRPISQLDATTGNLQKDGYDVKMNGTEGSSDQNVFLKDTASPPSYLSCGATCTTIQYKSMTRAHIESMGYNIVGNFGDQYSDLKGGYSTYTFKLPNPMYFLP